jgi:1,4-alpha-glucan branching enzyme
MVPQWSHDDPYRFPPVLGDMDVWLLGEGTHLRPYESAGCQCPHNWKTYRRHPLRRMGTQRVASQRHRGLSMFWDGRRHPMRLRRECGVWELFSAWCRWPGRCTNSRFVARDGASPSGRGRTPMRARSELAARHGQHGRTDMPPKIATISPATASANALDAPMSIYEVHSGFMASHEPIRLR